MVGFLRGPIIEENLEDPDHSLLSVLPLDLEIEEFCSSFLDIDSLSDWTKADKAMDDVVDLSTNLEKDNSGEKFGDLGTLIEEDVAYLNPDLGKSDSSVKLGDLGTSVKEEVAALKPSLEKSGPGEELGDLGTLIEEEMGKVKLEELADPSVNAIGLDVVKSEEVVSERSDSSSSDSSSSSDEEDDDDEGEVKGKVDMEDGEIQDSDEEKMVAWSEDEVDDEDCRVLKGPIKSKNELMDLPSVPPVEVSLLPHHHTVPVGVISSVIGTQVIVEGVEQHNPLNEGTVFWITESRSPLGLVDEIFGPVKSPYYIIRYNSEDEIPEGIKQGSSISFVPEFANHVLKDDLYKKGYDASGDNDEEISDEYEFSDDEKEAEYRKLQKMKKKRGTNEANRGNEFKEKKNFNRPGGSSQSNQFSRNGGGSVENNVLSRNGGGSVENNVLSRNNGGSVQNNAPQGAATQIANYQSQQYGTPIATSADNSNYQNPFSVGQNYGNAPGFVPPVQLTVQAPGFIPPSNVVWMNGMPGQQGMVFPNGMNGMPGQQGMVFPNGMMWPQQNQLPNGVPFLQQFAPNPNFSPHGILPGAQPNFSGAPSFGPWPFPSAQSGVNPQFGVAAPMNMNGQQCAPTPGNMEMPREFNQGAYQGGGRGRGRGGRFGRGRGRH